MSASQIVINVVDVLLVAYLIYRLLLLVRGTRAFRIVVGVVIFMVLLVLSDKLRLHTLHWVLDKFTFLAPAALVIFFLPELRTFIEDVGTLPQRLVPVGSGVAEDRAEARTIEELVAACSELSAESVGALIVIEKTAHLDEIVENGVSLHAQVSAPLLGAIFYDGNPLHDGAVIIRGDTILSAACRLPLSESSRIDQSLHMRHRAAIGAAENFDSIVIVVSEERGTISVAQNGGLKKMTPVELRQLLTRELRHMPDRTVVDRAKRSKGKKRSQDKSEELA
ncbi:diadenylate cyclase CdaA [soil metagenome]